MAYDGNRGLLAALHASLERSKTLVRICRALAKKPQARNSIDINYIRTETDGLPFMLRDGPGVHRDLCHVARVISLSEMDHVRLPHHCKDRVAMFYVLRGKVQIRTRTREPFDAVPNLGKRSMVSMVGGAGDGGGGDDPSSPCEVRNDFGVLQGVTEQEMRDLFNSIDVDGSGAIDVEELQYALEMMGARKSLDDVKELMDSVDDDGSGELEFEEFKRVLQHVLHGGQAGKETPWAQHHSGEELWLKEVSEGGCIGERGMLEQLTMEGMLLALDTTDLLVLDLPDWQHILENGFDGELKSKMGAIQSAEVLTSLMKCSDKRKMAYAMKQATYPLHSVLYEQGTPPQKLFLILEGQCKVIARVDGQGSSLGPFGGLRSGADTPTSQPGTPRRSASRSGPNGLLRNRRVELALLGPGDLCGEALITGAAAHRTGAEVSSERLVVLKLEKRDLRRLIHPADIQALRDHFARRDVERQSRLQTMASLSSRTGGLDSVRSSRDGGGGGVGGHGPFSSTGRSSRNGMEALFPWEGDGGHHSGSGSATPSRLVRKVGHSVNFVADLMARAASRSGALGTEASGSGLLSSSSSLMPTPSEAMAGLMSELDCKTGASRVGTPNPSMAASAADGAGDARRSLEVALRLAAAAAPATTGSATCNGQWHLQSAVPQGTRLPLHGGAPAEVGCAAPASSIGHGVQPPALWPAAAALAARELEEHELWSGAATARNHNDQKWVVTVKHPAKQQASQHASGAQTARACAPKGLDTTVLDLARQQQGQQGQQGQQERKDATPHREHPDDECPESLYQQLQRQRSLHLQQHEQQLQRQRGPRKRQQHVHPPPVGDVPTAPLMAPLSPHCTAPSIASKLQPRQPPRPHVSSPHGRGASSGDDLMASADQTSPRRFQHLRVETAALGMTFISTPMADVRHSGSSSNPAAEGAAHRPPTVPRLPLELLQQQPDRPSYTPPQRISSSRPHASARQGGPPLRHAPAQHHLLSPSQRCGSARTEAHRADGPSLRHGERSPSLLLLHEAGSMGGLTYEELLAGRLSVLRSPSAVPEKRPASTRGVVWASANPPRWDSSVLTAALKGPRGESLPPAATAARLDAQHRPYTSRFSSLTTRRGAATARARQRAVPPGPQGAGRAAAGRGRRISTADVSQLLREHDGRLGSLTRPDGDLPDPLEARLLSEGVPLDNYYDDGSSSSSSSSSSSDGEDGFLRGVSSRSPSPSPRAVRQQPQASNAAHCELSVYAAVQARLAHELRHPRMYSVLDATEAQALATRTELSAREQEKRLYGRTARASDGWEAEYGGRPDTSLSARLRATDETQLEGGEAQHAGPPAFPSRPPTARPLPSGGVVGSVASPRGSLRSARAAVAAAPGWQPQLWALRVQETAR